MTVINEFYVSLAFFDEAVYIDRMNKFTSNVEKSKEKINGESSKRECEYRVSVIKEMYIIPHLKAAGRISRTL